MEKISAFRTKIIQLSTWMRWPSPSVCQSWDLEKETFRYDSCFPYDVHFLYIRDIWFAFPEIRTTTFITYEFARSASTAHCCLRSKHNSSVEFSINIVCKEKKERIPGFTRIKNTKTLKKSLKNRELYLPKLVDCRTTWFYCVWRRRRHHDDEICQPRLRSAWYFTSGRHRGS